MTMWSHHIADDAHPKYMAIAEAIEQGIANDLLAPGAQLPPQRDLARELGVTVGTVGRGYAEARRRGLLSGEVGRGTFIRAATSEALAFGLAHGDGDNLINLAHNAPHFGMVDDLVRRGLEDGAARLDVSALEYQSHAGTVRHRAVAAQWLARSGLESSPDQLVVTSGAQHAMLIALSALVEPGDSILAEALEYPGLKAIARFLRVGLDGVAMDAAGLRPDAFEDACRRSPPKALYCTPSIQNPTATVLPEERRREIADIANRYGVTIIEDDTYGFLVTDAPPPLTAMSDSAIYLTSLSKCLAPGLRIGFLRAPLELVDRMTNAMMTTTIMASPIAAELTAVMIENGTADKVAAARRSEARERQQLAREILEPLAVFDGVHPESSHVWLRLPEPWRADEFAAEARSRGVAIAPAELFAVGRAEAPHCVRISLGAVADSREVERALRLLAEILRNPPMPSFRGM